MWLSITKQRWCNQWSKVLLTPIFHDTCLWWAYVSVLWYTVQGIMQVTMCNLHPLMKTMGCNWKSKNSPILNIWLFLHCCDHVSSMWTLTQLTVRFMLCHIRFTCHFKTGAHWYSKIIKLLCFRIQMCSEYSNITQNSISDWICRNVLFLDWKASVSSVRMGHVSCGVNIMTWQMVAYELWCWVNTVYCTLDSNTLNSLLPLALQNSLHLSLGETPAYFGIHCFIFPL